MSKKSKFLFIRRYFILIMRNRKTQNTEILSTRKTKEDFFFLQTKRNFKIQTAIVLKNNAQIEESFVKRSLFFVFDYKSFIDTYRKRFCNDGECSSIIYEKRT